MATIEERPQQPISQIDCCFNIYNILHKSIHMLNAKYMAILLLMKASWLTIISPEYLIHFSEADVFNVWDLICTYVPWSCT